VVGNQTLGGEVAARETMRLATPHVLGWKNIIVRASWEEGCMLLQLCPLGAPGLNRTTAREDSLRASLGKLVITKSAELVSELPGLVSAGCNWLSEFSPQARLFLSILVLITAYHGMLSVLPRVLRASLICAAGCVAIVGAEGNYGVLSWIVHLFSEGAFGRNWSFI